MKTKFLILANLIFIFSAFTNPSLIVDLSINSGVTCNGGNTGSITATVSSGTANYNYVWSNGSETLNTSSTTNTISSLAAGTYTLTVTDENDSTDVKSITITASNATATWTGATNSDWNTSTNWSSGVVPTDCYNLTIPNVANDPIIDQSSVSPAICNDIIINSGAVITVNATKAFTIRGVLTNNGTFTLKSDATGSGTLITESSITGSGTFNVEQYLTGNGGATPSDRRWYIGSPLDNATTATFNPEGDNRVWSHEEYEGYSELTTNSTSLIKAKSYVLRLGANETLNFTGSEFNTGNITNNNLTRTGTSFDKRGYHLVSNPYPSFVSWETVSKTNLSETMWVRTYNGTNMVFDTYNASTDIGTNNNGDGAVTELIAPMQGFWTLVETDGQIGTLTFNNDFRSHNSSLQLLSSKEKQLFRVKLSNGFVTDELVINFDANALESVEDYDSKKMYSGNLSELAALVEDEELVINSLPSAYSTEVPVKLNIINSGEFSLLSNGFEGMEQYNVFLEDKTLDVIEKFNEGEVYEFTSNEGALEDRFVLHIKSKDFPVSASYVEDESNVFAFNEMINVNLLNLNQGSIKVYNTMGQLVLKQTLTQNNTIIPTDLPSGIYIVEVINNDKLTTKKIQL